MARIDEVCKDGESTARTPFREKKAPGFPIAEHLLEPLKSWPALTFSPEGSTTEGNKITWIKRARVAVSLQSRCVSRSTFFYGVDEETVAGVIVGAA